LQIDVHYSLPKDDDVTGPCNREKNNGTLLLTLKSGRNLPIDEVGRVFSAYGEIKSIRPADGSE
jgi:hypothetical protein